MAPCLQCPQAMRWLVVMSVLAAGCADDAALEPRVCTREVRRTVFFEPIDVWDILFVVDRSPSMADEQARYAAVARSVGDALPRFRGALDVHLAVVSSDLGAVGVPGCDAGGRGGRFEADPRCGLDGSFLRWRNTSFGGPRQNFVGDPGDVTACMFDRPLSTCPVSQPLAAAVRALDGAHPAHDGFRRAGARLLVAVLTDGDDCSLVEADALARSGWPVDDEAAVDIACFAAGTACEPDDPGRPGPHRDCVARTGRGLADPARTLDAAAGGDFVWLSTVAARGDVVVDPGPMLASACAGGGTATAAPRLAGLRGDGRHATDVCSDDWWFVLDPLYPARPGWGPACLDAALDVEPEVPGMQARCRAWRVGDRPPVEVPWCGDAVVGPQATCLRLVADEPACPSGVALFPERGPEVQFPDRIDMRCEVPCE